MKLLVQHAEKNFKVDLTATAHQVLHKSELNKLQKALYEAMESLWSNTGAQDRFRKTGSIIESRACTLKQPHTFTQLKVVITHGGERRGYAEPLLLALIKRLPF